MNEQRIVHGFIRRLCLTFPALDPGIHIVGKDVLERKIISNPLFENEMSADSHIFALDSLEIVHPYIFVDMP